MADSSDNPLTRREGLCQGGRVGKPEEVPNLVTSFGNVRPWGTRVGSLGDVCPQPAMGAIVGGRGHQPRVIWGQDFRTKLSSNPAFAAEQHREASG
jgi:hypothetical protein